MVLKDQLTVHADDAIQKTFYSGKQKRHTVKNLLFIDVGGYVHFLSDTCEGKKNDKKIADERRV
jgi:hypothetical protein